MSATPLTGLEKAAVLLKSLPAAVADKVLGRMEPRQATRLRAELAAVAKRPDLKETLTRILDEAAQALSAKKPEPGRTRTSAASAAHGGQIDVHVGAAAEAPPAEAPVATDPLRELATIRP